MKDLFYLTGLMLFKIVTYTIVLGVIIIVVIVLMVESYK